VTSVPPKRLRPSSTCAFTFGHCRLTASGVPAMTHLGAWAGLGSGQQTSESSRSSTEFGKNGDAARRRLNASATGHCCKRI
jgi:hypothetical protein